jgi:hypothetical protein
MTSIGAVIAGRNERAKDTINSAAGTAAVSTMLVGGAVALTHLSMPGELTKRSSLGVVGGAFVASAAMGAIGANLPDGFAKLENSIAPAAATTAAIGGAAGLVIGARSTSGLLPRLGGALTGTFCGALAGSVIGALAVAPLLMGKLGALDS